MSPSKPSYKTRFVTNALDNAERCLAAHDHEMALLYLRMAYGSADTMRATQAKLNAFIRFNALHERACALYSAHF